MAAKITLLAYGVSDERCTAESIPCTRLQARRMSLGRVARCVGQQPICRTANHELCSDQSKYNGANLVTCQGCLVILLQLLTVVDNCNWMWSWTSASDLTSQTAPVLLLFGLHLSDSCVALHVQRCPVCEACICRL